jgi:hypothetical protein
VTERLEVARLSRNSSSAEFDTARAVVKCARLCKRVVEAQWNGTEILFFANVRRMKSSAHKRNANV